MSPDCASARLLIVHHSPSPPLHSLLEAATTIAEEDDLANVGDIEVVARPALAATPSDVLAADAYLFGTPANFGYMSGALKHFFDTTYYTVLGDVDGRPYGQWVHGNDDVTGAVTSVAKLAKGMGLCSVADPVGVTDGVTPEVRSAVRDLAGVVLATALGVVP